MWADEELCKRCSRVIKVLTVFGTRPEAVKMVPVIQALESFPNIESRVCVTGQHREMLDQVLDFFEVKPDFDLQLMQQGQSLASLTARLIEGIDKVLEQERPDVVLVHGDTTTSITKVGGGTVDGTAFASYNTIDKIFTAIQNTLDIHGNVNATTYHTTQGYPIQVDLDPHPNLADDEESLQVSDFQVL